MTRIGKYELLDELGRGGMGIVYRGIDAKIGREVAIKTLTQGLIGDADMLARFYDEGRRTGRLNHPNIVTVYDLGDDNGTPYIVMERVEGESLDKLQKSFSLPTLIERLKIIEDVCLALAYAHQNNVIHRDVKPANVLVQPDGKVKLLDFGIARVVNRDVNNVSHTRTGNLIGTIPYMAPERLNNGVVDGRSDIFSAGVLLYQLVTDQLPFEGEHFALMQSILNHPHPRLSDKLKQCPVGLEQIVDRALAKSPDDRYSTAEEMAVDLNNVITRLNLERARKLLPEARRLIATNEFTRARNILQQLIRLQRDNTEARDLLGEIQKQLSLRQRNDKIKHLRSDAELAFEEKRFDQSLSILKEGFALDPANQSLTDLMEKVKQAKNTQAQISALLKEADFARRAGDYVAAIAAAQKALTVDKLNSKIIVLCDLLTREAEQVQRQKESRELLDLAKGAIASRRFKDAIARVKEAELLDPTDPELSTLLADATLGLDRSIRKEAVTKLEDAMAFATTYEQLENVATDIQRAIDEMPTEAALFRLKATAERNLKEHRHRREIETLIVQCRRLETREALKSVRAARERFPAEERLLSLEGLLETRLKEQTVDERRNEYLSRARVSLSKDRYRDAIDALEICDSEGLGTEEVRSLLEFARNQDAELIKQASLRSTLAQAASLLCDKSYDEAIAFLQRAIQSTDDGALRLLLDQAILARDALHKEIDTLLLTAKKLLRAKKTDAAIELLEMQPAGSQVTAVQIAISLLKDEADQVLYRTIGHAYARITSDPRVSDLMIRKALLVSGQSPVVGSIAAAFRTRLCRTTDTAIKDSISTCKRLLRDGRRVDAVREFQTMSKRKSLASESGRAELDRLWARINRFRFLIGLWG